MQTERILQLKPEQIVAENNIRYALLRGDTAQLEQDITDEGEVLQPIEVEPLDEPQDGVEYRLTVGFRRHRAVENLNKKGAGLTLPAIVRPLADAKQRLKHQISENVSRKSLSPMDTATAIKQMLDAGFSRTEIRETFARPSSLKGHTSEPASNAWLNMTMSFPSFPKDIREKIHNGTLGVAAAYELTKVSEEKWPDVLAEAEKERQSAIAKHAREEEKFVKVEEALEEVKAKATDTGSKLERMQAEVEQTRKLVEERTAAAKEAYELAQSVTEKKEKKAATETWKAADKDAKGAQNKLAADLKQIEKLAKAKEKVEGETAKLSAKLIERKKVKPVGPADIRRGAQKVADGGAVALTIADVRKLLQDLSLNKKYPKVAKIGEALREAIDGVNAKGEKLKQTLSGGQLMQRLAAVTGEEKKKK